MKRKIGINIVSGVQIFRKFKESGIKFEDLPLGSTFVVRSGEEIQEPPYEWIGMKVASAIDWEEHSYYILDLSDECGSLYEDVDMYNIVRLIDLKVVEDEGEE